MEPEPKRKRGRHRLTDAQRSNAAEKRKSNMIQFQKSNKRKKRKESTEKKEMHIKLQSCKLSMNSTRII